jgi:transcriptional regulator with XRE-family HTH domain
MRTHERMRQARERKGLSVIALADSAGLRTPVVDAIERGAFSELPSGLYGRSAVRAYAKAVGLDPDEILPEVSAELRLPEDPLEGLVRVHGLRPRPKREPAPAVPCWEAQELEDREWRFAAASAIDGALLISHTTVLVQLTAVAAGTGVADVIHAAGPALVLIVAIVAVTYFVLLGGVRNATFGCRLAQVRPERRSCGQADRIDASEAVRRAARCALRESSIVLEWVSQRRRYTVSWPDLNATGRSNGLSAIR